MTSPRGFTLVELIVAMSLALVVAGLLHRELLHGRRLARAQAERMAMQDNVRTAALVLSAELGAVGRDEITPEAAAILGLAPEVRSDLLAIAPGAVTYRAARGTGVVCSTTGVAPPELLVAAWSWSSLRAPRATDSLLVFVEGDPATGTDDAWLHLGVLSVAGASCPDGRAALAIRAGAPAGLAPASLAAIAPGAPVRLVEVMQARYYQSGGKSWLGLRSVSTGEAITPVAGPLADSTAGVRGLTFRYHDAADAPTSDPTAVRAIEIALLGVTDQPIHGRDPRRPLADSFALTTRVALRNAMRP
jgi:prepilin-type N-terminal cleavage/methylation domain-containing protein